MTTATFTRAAGVGPLPRLLEQAGGLRAVERVFGAEGLPLWRTHNQSSNLPVRCLTGLIERPRARLATTFSVSTWSCHAAGRFRPRDPIHGFGDECRRPASAIGSRLALSHVWSRVRLCARSKTMLNGKSELSSGLTRGEGTTPTTYFTPMLTALRRYLGPRWSPLRIKTRLRSPFLLACDRSSIPGAGGVRVRDQRGGF